MSSKSRHFQEAVDWLDAWIGPPWANHVNGMGSALAAEYDRVADRARMEITETDAANHEAMRDLALLLAKWASHTLKQER